jgi:ATP-binding cassette subfamily C protein LapB
MKRDEVPPEGPALAFEPTEDAQTAEFRQELWLDALRLVAQYYRLPLSVQGVKLAAVSVDPKATDETKLQAVARRMGLGIKLVDPRNINLSIWHVPFILELTDGQLAVVHNRFQRTGRPASG